MQRIASDDANGDEFVTRDHLEAVGLTPADVRRRYPQAVERTDLDGQPCWHFAELEEWPDEGNTR
jgi:hypothetical protein